MSDELKDGIVCDLNHCSSYFNRQNLKELSHKCNKGPVKPVILLIT